MWGAGGENRMRKLMHQDKDREIANQLLLQATQTRLGENSLTAPLWAFPMGCSASGKNLCCSMGSAQAAALPGSPPGLAWGDLPWHPGTSSSLSSPWPQCSLSCFWLLLFPSLLSPWLCSTLPFLKCTFLRHRHLVCRAQPSPAVGLLGPSGQPLTTSAQAPTSSTAKKLWTRE